MSDPEEKAWIQARIEGAGQGHRLHRRGQEGDPAEAGRGRRLRAVHRRQVQGHQALRPRRRRIADPGAGADHQARRLARHEGHRARHGASRPAERALPGDGQAAPRHLPRVQGRLLRARRRRGLRRREVPSRRVVGPRVRRQQGASVADRQPVASRNRRPGGDGQGPRQAGPAVRPHPRGDRAAGGARQGAAAAAAWRRGLRRPGRHRRNPRPVRPARPPRRRHAAFHHQQPDRLHHQSALLALVALSVGCRQDDRGADLPRQRRRSGSGGPCRQGGDRIPHEVPQAGRGRHVLLPPLRPQ